MKLLWSLVGLAFMGLGLWVLFGKIFGDGSFRGIPGIMLIILGMSIANMSAKKS